MPENYMQIIFWSAKYCQYRRIAHNHHFEKREKKMVREKGAMMLIFLLFSGVVRRMESGAATSDIAELSKSTEKIVGTEAELIRRH